MVDPEGAVLKKDLAGADPQGIDSKSVAEKKSPGQTIDTHHEGRCNPLWKITEIMQDDQQGKKGQRYEAGIQDRKSTRLNSSHVAKSYAVFCLTKQTTNAWRTLPPT